MSWQQRMKNALDYLEESICETVDYEKTASMAAGTSTHLPTHLNGSLDACPVRQTKQPSAL